MKEQDFLVCTFEGDATVYVAEILTVANDSFECRFVHTESHYTFSRNTWTVLQTTGAFPTGTVLTSHNLYTPSGNEIDLNDFVAVEFSNGKRYLGRITTLQPQTVKFLHKASAVYVFEDNVITNSGGIYPKGQNINDIEAYQLSNDGEDTADVDLSLQGISYNGKEFAAMAQEIQGNILKSHGRDNTSHIFFKFNNGKKEDAKTFIKNFAETKITSALKQKQDSDRINAEKKLAALEQRAPNLEELQTIFISFLLSNSGYAFLEIDTGAFDFNFTAGMKNANTSNMQLFDNPVANWEAEYQNEIHGMILIAASGKDRTALDAETNNITNLLTGNALAEIIKTEKGNAVKNADQQSIEHFGYVDGISQPKFFTEELSEMKDDNVQTTFWNPLMPLNLVLVKDDGGTNKNSFGSYMVFRKLEQDVNGFNSEVARLSNDLFGSSSPDKAQLAGAMLVGRFKNGVPVTLTSDNEKLTGNLIDPALRSRMNDFNFSDDTSGAKCPFHAHIRKTNPRGESASGSLDAEKQHMMARRGIPYGKQEAESGKGLLFMSFQASIDKQFEYQQEVFANADIKGKDPLIAQGDLENQEQKYAKVYGDSNSIVSAKPFGGFVSLKGGEYFFAPSISFLQNLS